MLVLARIVRDTGVSRLLAKLPGSVGLQFAMLEATRPAYRAPNYRPASNNPGPQVVLLRGCVMSGLFAHTNRATHRVLTANGYNVVRSSGDGCCGALHVHAGDVESARAMAKRNIEAFEQLPDASIAINASGCGAMLKEYGLLFEDDAVWGPRAAAVASRARDVSELLARQGPRAGGRLTVRVAYDAPCHLMHAQRVVSQPIAVLDAIPGLQRVPLAGHDACCGSAGIYNLLEPDLSQAVLNPKISAILASGAEVVATGNPGCIMQIGAGLLRENSAVRVVHPVDILDASYASAFETASPAPGAS
jgi:glycolate oxidase iron-sulfur subunit